MEYYYNKYLKYKQKYINLKFNQTGGNKKDIVALYKTHDNGGRPYKCVIYKNNNIEVYCQINNNSDKITYDKKATYKFKTKNIFIGKSPFNKMTEFSGGYGAKFDGNSILLNIDDNKYIFIGDKVWSFVPKGKIVEFISPVGNNDVPYPWAVDEYKNIYLFTFNVIIMYRKDVYERLKKYDDPNDYYLDYELITADLGVKNSTPKIDMDIKSWFIGKHPYTLTYSSKNDINKHTDKMYIVDSNGNKKHITKNDLIAIINKFGNLQSFRPLIKKNI